MLGSVIPKRMSNLLIVLAMVSICMWSMLRDHVDHHAILLDYLDVQVPKPRAYGEVAVHDPSTLLIRSNSRLYAVASGQTFPVVSLDAQNRYLDTIRRREKNDNCGSFTPYSKHVTSN